MITRKLLLLAATFFLVVPLFAEVSSKSLDLYPEPEKRYFRAAGEAIIIGYSPWLYSHYVKDYPYADISVETVKTNFTEGFTYDRDNFQTNQWGHPFQGSLYFNAARINGFSFWESAPFVLLGDFGWEFFMEAERPAYNDMVNTFFGGMSRGEITYRLSSMVLDNSATGWDRFWDELGAGILNPVRFIDRAVFGDMWKTGPNPPDRLPDKFFLMVDGGYQHGRSDSAHPNQGYFTAELRQNDPHEYPIRKPFDYYDLEGTVSTAKGPLIPFMMYRGLLAGWDLKDEADVHHLLAPALGFNYFNNEASSVGGQDLELTLLSRWKLRNDFQLRTELGAQGYLLAGIQTDFTQNSLEATGRNYDFGSGGGPRVDIRIRRDEVDWFRCSVSAGWYVTNNGISSQNHIFLVNTEARYPLTHELYAGIGWAFQDRYTLYPHLPATSRTDSEIKLFLSWAFRIIG